MLCREFVAVRSHTKGFFVMPLCCRSWTCEYCAPKRKRQVVAQAKSGHPNKFITLTVNPATGEDRADRAAKLARAWRLIVKRVKRYYGYKDVQYFCVFEAHESGEPHLHILARVGWIGQKWLSQQLKDITGAFVVDIRKVRSQAQMAYYVAKYVGKEPGKFGTCKRYWTTRSWSQTKKVYKERFEDRYSAWKIEHQSIATVLAIVKNYGWTYTQDGDLYDVRYRAPP